MYYMYVYMYMTYVKVSVYIYVCMYVYLYMAYVKVSVRANSKSSDGSVWNRGYWTEGVMVTIRRLANKEDRKRSKAIMCVEYLLKEMEKLR